MNSLVNAALTEQQEARLHRIACDLLQDPDLAEDAVQHARIQAARGAPAEPKARGAWLTRVTRRQSSKLLQRGLRERQVQREAGARRATSVPSASDVVARSELYEHLDRAIASLPDAYRQCVQLRYFDGLPPRDIAERLGIPVATVHSRIRRGLEQLRADLDRSAGRSSWRAVLLPVLPTRSSAHAAWLFVLLAIAVALPTALFVHSWTNVPAAGLSIDGDATVVSNAVADTNGSRANEDGTAKRIAAGIRAGQGSVPLPWPLNNPFPDKIVEGTVRDEFGRPVASAEILAGGSPGSCAPTGTKTDDDGRYRVRVSYLCNSICAQAPGFRCPRAGAILSAIPVEGSTTPPVLVDLRLIRGAGRLRGRVRKSSGAAAVRAEVVARSLAPPVDALDAYNQILLRAETDAAGRFEIEGVPPGKCEIGAALRHEIDEFGSAIRDVTIGSVVEVELVTKPVFQLAVTVLEHDGTPIEEAIVSTREGRHRFGSPCDTDRSGEASLYDIPAANEVVIHVRTADGREHSQIVAGVAGTDQVVVVRMPAPRRAPVVVRLVGVDAEIAECYEIQASDSSEPAALRRSRWTLERGHMLHDCPDFADLRVVDTDTGLSHASAQHVDTRSGLVMLSIETRVASVHGEVTGEVEGVPSELVVLRLRSTGEDSLTSSRGLGTFGFAGVPFGNYEVVLETQILPRVVLGSVRVASETVQVPPLSVPPAGKLRWTGSSRDDMVELRDASGALVRSWACRVEQTFPLWAGDYELTVRGQKRTFHVLPGQETREAW
ncbi:MAG: sigma-70 family RNA polymerase sigma factor [Planctomycetes bacterium]|nr:sigma-70 family RNA polymerase sigma factor [Planctomycetota bacterium]MCB9920122.1 sigma-70 family RNA polymerase sigma factor [Planctomycetota bacterium]